ncbi:MAG: hypothetical protein IPL46_06170 [Saprospiraceae bacterium]|nr:hypothetical protein [Saprospiraceae bacterium]
MAVYTITLFVDTINVTQENTDKTCNFGQGRATKNKDFSITVEIGDTIIWRGLPLRGQSNLVNIEEISYVGDNNIFGTPILEGNNQKPELVIGNVMNDSGGEEENYAISFTVSNKPEKLFRIDPKLQVH